LAIYATTCFGDYKTLSRIPIAASEVAFVDAVCWAQGKIGWGHWSYALVLIMGSVSLGILDGVLQGQVAAMAHVIAIHFIFASATALLIADCCSLGVARHGELAAAFPSDLLQTITDSRRWSGTNYSN
jgi:hypothetical protein